MQWSRDRMFLLDEVDEVSKMASEKRLYIQVVEKIMKLIESGDYPVGSRLPAERQLAEELNVSRPTIREAVIALEARGYVSVKTGSGVYVLERVPSSSGLGSVVSPFELVEARVLIEGEAAALAAPMISEEQLAEMKDAIEQMARDDAASTVADRRFHLVISTATQNRAFISIVMQLWDAQESLEHIRQAHQAVCVRDKQVRLDEHIAIYDALASGDSNAARTAMRKHFSRMLNALHDTNEEREVQKVRQQVSQIRERFSFERLVE